MQIDHCTSDLESTRIADRLAARLISSRGAEGIAELVTRLRPYWARTRAALQDADPVTALGEAVIDAATGGDHDDLVTSEIRIRHLGASAVIADLGVCAAIVRALLDTLWDDDPEQVHAAALAIASQPGAKSWRGIGIVNLVLSRLHLDRGEFDLAAAAAKSNLDRGMCPTSQYMLYRSLAARAKAGGPVSSSEIFIGDLSNRFCAEPFHTLATGSGRLGGPPEFFACSCPGTLPYPLAPARPDATRDQLWNGAEIREIRRSILDGDFTYCSRKACPYIVHGTLPTRAEIADPSLRDIIDNHRVVLDSAPSRVTLGHDPSCNLACPSCRTELITLRTEARAAFDDASRNILLPLLEGETATVIVATDGDPFASKHYRNLLHGLDPVRHAGIRISLITNGLLLTREEWESLGHVQKLIGSVGVSIDGARAATYENLRRPGKWSVITENMAFLAALRRDGKLPYLHLQFVVQRENFEEIAEFVTLGKHWGVDLVRFIRLVNIGSYDADKFAANDVCDPRHPEFPRLLRVLRDPVLADPVVDMFTLKPLYDQALRDQPAARGIVARFKSMLRDRTPLSA